MALSRTTRLKRYLRKRMPSVVLRAPTYAVAGVAAYVSYGHLVAVGQAHHASADVAAVTPLSVDGLLIVAARYITSAKTRTGKAWSIVGFLLGVVATLAGNVLAAPPDLIARLYAVWPAIALVTTAGILHWGALKPKRSRSTTTSRPSTTSTRRGLHAVA